MLGLGAFALAKTNISGEIGEDAILWTAAALAVVLYVESGSTAPESSVQKFRIGGAAILLCR